MLCLLPLLYTYLASPSLNSSNPRAVRLVASIKRRLSPRRKDASAQYLPVGQDVGPDSAVTTTTDGLDTLSDDGFTARQQGLYFEPSKWALFWLPALCDMAGTTLMNAGLILTPVSIYQMTRGSVVLFVGVLSVIFLRRESVSIAESPVSFSSLTSRLLPFPSGHLHRYQWFSLLCVMIGVSLVGLSGSLKSSAAPDASTATTSEEESAAKVFIGILLILFAQLFTATQVSFSPPTTFVGD